MDKRTKAYRDTQKTRNLACKKIEAIAPLTPEQAAQAAADGDEPSPPMPIHEQIVAEIAVVESSLDTINIWIQDAEMDLTARQRNAIQAELRGLMRQIGCCLANMPL